MLDWKRKAQCHSCDNQKMALLHSGCRTAPRMGKRQGASATAGGTVVHTRYSTGTCRSARGRNIRNSTDEQVRMSRPPVLTPHPIPDRLPPRPNDRPRAPVPPVNPMSLPTRNRVRKFAPQRQARYPVTASRFQNPPHVPPPTPPALSRGSAHHLSEEA